MVFSKLSAQEKGAFFGLLDEYFQSRPELFGQGQGVSGLAGTGISTTAAASAVQRALASNSALTGSNERTSSGGASSLGHLKSTNPFSAAGLATPSSGDVARAMSVGRVAAASLAFSQPGAGGGLSPSPSASSSPSLSLSPASPPPPAPSLPRRGMFSMAAPEQTVNAIPGSEVDKLVTRKTGVLSALKKQPMQGVVIPPAFVPSKSPFGPPPVRRAASETGAEDGSSGAEEGSGAGTMQRLGGIGGSTQRLGVSTQRLGGVGGTTRAVPPRLPPPEEQAKGEWAEVLYDYHSEDPGDLAIEAGTRVLVTARSSEDWWTGQVEGQGREGLFPASYVKLS